MFSFARVLDRADGPLYRQAAAVLRAAISAGTLEVGTELPREATLADLFGVSMITIRAALRELEGEGLIRKRAAKTAVVTRALPDGWSRDVNSLDDIVAATRDLRLEIDSYAPRRSAEAASCFALAQTALVPCLRGRLWQGKIPLSDLTIFFPPNIGGRLTRADFDDVVVFRSVERRLGLRVAGARITVAAEVANAGLARRLAYRLGGAVLVSRMLYLDGDGRPVELTIARHRADRYRLSHGFGNAA